MIDHKTAQKVSIEIIDTCESDIGKLIEALSENKDYLDIFEPFELRIDKNEDYESVLGTVKINRILITLDKRQFFDFVEILVEDFASSFPKIRRPLSFVFQDVCGEKLTSSFSTIRYSNI